MSKEELERQIRVLNVKVDVIVGILDRCFYRRSRDANEVYDDSHHVEFEISRRLRELDLEKKGRDKMIKETDIAMMLAALREEKKHHERNIMVMPIDLQGAIRDAQIQMLMEILGIEE